MSDETLFNYEQARNSNQKNGQQREYTVADHEREVHEARTTDSGATADASGRDASERQDNALVESLFRGKKPDNGGQEVAPDGTVRGSVDKNRIQSDTPYKIFGSEETKDGTRVYVDQYPTQKTDEEAKKYWQNHYGNLVGGVVGVAGTLSGMTAPGRLVDKAFNTVGRVGTGGVAYWAGSSAAEKLINLTDPSMPVLEQDGKRFVKVTP